MPREEYLKGFCVVCLNGETLYSCFVCFLAAAKEIFRVCGRANTCKGRKGGSGLTRARGVENANCEAGCEDAAFHRCQGAPGCLGSAAGYWRGRSAP